MITRKITIPKSDIFFDVDAATHIFAQVSEPATGEKRSDALESDSGNDLARMMLTRFSDRRAAELGERLSRFMETPASPVTETVVTMGSASEYEFTLHLEAAFQDELLAPLASAMESYIAHGVTADWYTDAGDAHAAAYLNLLPGDLTLIGTYLVKRKFPSRV